MADEPIKKIMEEYLNGNPKETLMKTGMSMEMERPFKTPIGMLLEALGFPRERMVEVLSNPYGGIMKAQQSEQFYSPKPQGEIEWQNAIQGFLGRLVGEAIPYETTPQQMSMIGIYGGPKATGFAKAGNKFSGMADKMERFEIDDSLIKLKPKFDDFIHGNKKLKLGELIEHSELFEQYPFLRDYKVKPGEKAAFDSATKTIELNKHNYIIERLTGKRRYDWEITPNTIGSTKMEKGNIVPLSPEEIIVEEIKAKESAYNVIKKDIIHEIQHIIQMHEGFPRGGDFRTPGYQILAGEIEARDVAKRMGLTKEQRLTTPPYSSENIPLSEWIKK